MKVKDAYYFPHDSNARFDIKIAELRQRHGWAGYGLYWGIIEVLRDQDGYKFEANKKQLLSICLSCAYAELEPVLSTCFEVGLLDILDDDVEYFFSPSLTRRMQRLDDIREKRKSAGAKGGRASNKDKQSLSKLEAKEKQCSSSKVKESKVNKRKEYIARDADIEKLFDLFWSKYPRRDAKIPAQKAFRNLFTYELTDEQCNVRFQNMGVRIAQLIAEGRERKHIPLPATFLNREDFDTAPEPIETEEVEFVEVANA